MLSRRYLRIKTMQALYSYFKHDKPDKAKFEAELFKSIDQVYDLYLIILGLFCDLRSQELQIMEENKHKRLPKPEDLNPNMKFVNNSLLLKLADSSELKNLLDKKRLSVLIDSDLERRILVEIKKSEEYQNYMSDPAPASEKEDIALLGSIISNILVENNVLTSLFEDKNIYWSDDLHMAYHMALKSFEYNRSSFVLIPLYKDEKDDKQFVSNLFQKTILYKDEYTSLIKEHVKNWELDRIAEMDMLLMQMCITEFIHLPNIPVKASLNEYIDISKEYSTPNSRVFINGILDKVIIQLKAENKIVKEGRGLKES